VVIAKLNLPVHLFHLFDILEFYFGLMPDCPVTVFFFSSFSMVIIPSIMLFLEFVVQLNGSIELLI
jgi:hypothetical protein